MPRIARLCLAYLPDVAFTVSFLTSACLLDDRYHLRRCKQRDISVQIGRHHASVITGKISDDWYQLITTKMRFNAGGRRVVRIVQLDTGTSTARCSYLLMLPLTATWPSWHC